MQVPVQMYVPGRRRNCPAFAIRADARLAHVGQNSASYGENTER